MVGDGAMGTMLLERALEPGEAPESATLAHRQVLVEIASAYVDAGADLIETNTFGASPLKLALAGLDSHTEALNREAVRAAREAAGSQAYVVGSCGPSGRLLKPYGDTEAVVIYDSFREQIELLIAMGVDGIFIETMTDLAEAKLALAAVKDTWPELPVATLMTFDLTPRGFFTIMGTSVEAAASTLAETGADAVGSNCGNGIDNMVRLAEEFRHHTDLPLVIQANAGLPRTIGSKVVYDESPAFMADRARELLGLGASVIGGCCGTTPEHIRALRQMVDAVE
jgi:5-methyltetrahydrofolate--homocysteine methyltransferase